MIFFSHRFSTSFFIFGILLAGQSFSQTTADKEAVQRRAENIQRQEQERIQRDQDEARRPIERIDGIDTRSLQPKVDVPALGASCRDIREIVIKGATKLPDWKRERTISNFTGRCLNVGDIESLLAEITRYYIDDGFVTVRAYLPPQDLSEGHLDILVIEGVVESISIEDGNTRSVSIANTFPDIEGRLLNLRDLEQGIDQINRLASNNAKLDIQPGKRPGESRVSIVNKPASRLHFNLASDNQGSESTGAVQTGFTASADNALGFNEFFSATHRQSTPNDYTRKYSGSDSFNFNIPFGYSSLSVGTSYSRYASVVRVPSGLELISSGNSKTSNVRLDRVMYRDSTTRASLAGTITTKGSINYLDGQLLGISSRNLTVLDIDGSLSVGFAGGVLALDLGYAQGLNAMGALVDPAALPDSAPRAQFSKLKAGFNYLLPFRFWGIDVLFNSQLSSQRAGSTLYGSEQIAIGGIYSVRGFVKNTLAGDDGYYWRNEVSVRQPLTFGSETVSTRFYVGYDSGRVKNRTANIPDGRLTGLVIGVSANWRGLSLDVFNTQPLMLLSTMTREPSQTWLRVSTSF